jgi:hypothetical protein
MTETVKLVILQDSNSQVLLLHRGSYFALPTITIPRKMRTAWWVTDNILDAWSLKTVCLFQLSIENAPNHNQYIVLESCDPRWKPPTGLQWASRGEICGRLESECEAHSLQYILQHADAYNNGELAGPFAQAGWLNTLLSWVQENIDSLGLRLTGQFRQFNADPFFCLIRIETNGPALWFKAIGEPNLQEYSITLGLAHDHPLYLPNIVATRPEWNGWLMLEVQGESLDSKAGIEQWQRVAEGLAKLQLECIGRASRLLTIGCKDRRVSKIVEQIDPFLETMDKLMQEQPHEPPPRLNRLQLHELGRSLKDACWRMQSAGIPDSLVHGDFGPGNVRLNARSCVFLDWAEGCVGPPFSTFEYLIAHFIKYSNRLVQGDLRLRRAYSRAWLTLVSPEQISESMTLAPAIAVFIYALGSVALRQPTLWADERYAQSLRSLTRRMYSELVQQKKKPRSRVVVKSSSAK